MQRATMAWLWLSLLALAAAVSLQRLYSFDYWWHLRTGWLIFETGAVPFTDPYTFTVPGASWLDIHWLFQLILYGIYLLGGHGAVVISKFVQVAMLLGILAATGGRKKHPLVLVPVLALVLLSGDRFMPRPEFPSFVLLAAVLALHDRYRRRPDAVIYGVVAVQLVWANVHGLFALGIAVSGIAMGSEMLRSIRYRSYGPRWDRLKRLSAVVLLSILVSAVNPNGLEGLLYPVRQLGMIGTAIDPGPFSALIIELLPPFHPDSALSPFFLAVLCVIECLGFLSIALNWRRVPTMDSLLWIAFSYLAMTAERNIVLLAIVSAPIIVRNLSDVLARRSASPRAAAALAALIATALLVCAVDVARDGFYARIGVTRQTGLGVMRYVHPESAVAWIAANRPPGPICHELQDGGYLLWHLYPEYRSMLDGRLEVFGLDKLAELRVTGPKHFTQLDSEQHFGTVIARYHDTRLFQWLYRNPFWKLEHAGEIAGVFVRRARGSVASGQRQQQDAYIDDPELFGPLEAATTVEGRLSRIARASFYTAVRRHDRALAILEDSPEVIAAFPQVATLRDYLRQRVNDDERNKKAARKHRRRGLP